MWGQDPSVLCPSLKVPTTHLSLWADWKEGTNSSVKIGDGPDLRAAGNGAGGQANGGGPSNALNGVALCF